MATLIVLASPHVTIRKVQGVASHPIDFANTLSDQSAVEPFDSHHKGKGSPRTMSSHVKIFKEGFRVSSAADGRAKSKARPTAGVF